MIFVRNDKIFAKVWKIEKKEKYADLADILFILRTNISTLNEAIKVQCYDEYTRWSYIYKREDKNEHS